MFIQNTFQHQAFKTTPETKTASLKPDHDIPLLNTILLKLSAAAVLLGILTALHYFIFASMGF